MTIRTVLPAVAALLLVGVYAVPAVADAIEVPQAEFRGLSDDQKKDLADQLKDVGAIGADDELEYSGDDSAPKSLDPASIAAILAFLGPKICTYIVDSETGKRKRSCEKRKTDEAKAACTARVEGWSKPLTDLCALIKLQ